MDLLPNFLQQSKLAPIAGSLPPHHSRIQLSDGTKGTAETISLMQELTANGKRNDDVRKVVGDVLTGKIPGFTRQNPKDYENYAKALYTFCRDHILYAYDPHLVEYIESPDRVLKNGIGDCDSTCTLLSSMLQQIGLATQFVTIKADPARKDEFSHVYLRVKIPGKGWIACDPIMPRQDWGWEPPVHFGKQYWHGSSDERDMPLDTKASLPMSGLGQEEGGFLDWLFGSSEPSQEVPTDILPGPITQPGNQYPQYPQQMGQPGISYPQPVTCPVGYIQTATGAWPPRYGCTPSITQPTPIPWPTSIVPTQTTRTDCQQFVERQKAYSKAAALARKNYNECRSGKALSLSGMGDLGRRLKPRPMNRPMKPMSKPSFPKGVKPSNKMRGLGCGCSATPVMAGMGAMNFRPVIDPATGSIVGAAPTVMNPQPALIPGDTYLDKPDFLLPEIGLDCKQIVRLIRKTEGQLKIKRRLYEKLRLKPGRAADPVADEVKHLQNTLLELKTRLSRCMPKGMSGLGCGSCAVTAMAGLGCGDKPCAPCAAKKAAGMGDLGADVDASVMAILDGTTQRDLLNVKADIDDQGRKLDATYQAIQSITDPSQKQRALASYDTASRALAKTFSEFNKARSEYNNTITKLRAYVGALPGYQPNWLPGLAGLGAAPAIPVAYIVAAVAAGAITIGGAYAMANLVRALRGQADNSRGYIEQTADLVRASGGAAKDFGTGLSTAVGAAWSAAQIAAIGGVGYLVYKNWSTIKDVLKGNI